jgi:hypothetical protein
MERDPERICMHEDEPRHRAIYIPAYLPTYLPTRPNAGFDFHLCPHGAETLRGAKP